MAHLFLVVNFFEVQNGKEFLRLGFKYIYVKKYI